ncbi:MAG TPA: L-dopachrome tautomerase-related protein [Candidatus Methylacidiphilales bacterium]
MRCLLLLATALSLAALSIPARADLPTRRDPRLVVAYTSDRIWNGVATTPDGRLFACFPSADRPGLQLAELAKDGSARAYPDIAWNSWQPGDDPASAFVHVNSVRLGPDGKLWVVDAGAPGIGKAPVPGAARLIAIDLATNTVVKAYDLSPATRETSYIDDVRFHGNRAYLTDAGAPALLVLDLADVKPRRVLAGNPAATDLRPMRADGKVLRDGAGREVRIHADQIEISPDGRYVYFQPASGPLARIERRWLDDPTLDAPALAARVEAAWVDTPTSGGTAIDADGNLYYGDADGRRILMIAPSGTVTTLVEDPRLVWTDALWIDSQGWLWIPAAQLNRSRGLNGGRDGVRYPVELLKMKLPPGTRPAPNDHP